MTGANVKINNNIAGSLGGGGVFMKGDSGCFYMDDGKSSVQGISEISGNEATGNGGGVLVDGYSSFRMTLGVIRDNTSGNEDHGNFSTINVSADLLFWREGTTAYVGAAPISNYQVDDTPGDADVKFNFSNTDENIWAVVE
jgi:hypothetical protein